MTQSVDVCLPCALHGLVDRWLAESVPGHAFYSEPAATTLGECVEELVGMLPPRGHELHDLSAGRAARVRST